MDHNKKPFHEIVAENLIRQLEAGTAPWQRPWAAATSGHCLPYNPTTSHRYKGINALHLMAQNRADPRWLTYRQAMEAGAQVRKGEQGTRIQFWKFSEDQIKKDINGNSVLDDQGKPVKVVVPLERPRVFFATVFNGEQIDDLPPIPNKEQTWNTIERAEQLLKASNAVIQHNGGNHAYYRLATDSIHVPDKSQFLSADRYFATVLHELGHWSGHPSRLNRDLAHPFGSEGYAKEELRAEIASLLLGDELGIGHDPGQHAAYVGSWIKVLKDDPLELFRAAADAEKIQGYILNLAQQIQEQIALQTQTQSEQVQEMNMSANPFHQDLFKADAVKDSAMVMASTTRLEEAGEKLGSQSVSTIDSAFKTEFDDKSGKAHHLIYLNVPFKQKNQVKQLGARWDHQQQAWYILPGVNPMPFAQWRLSSPTQSTSNAHHRVYLAVPYGERALAKAAGAVWDKAAKAWYAGPNADLVKLERWFPDRVSSQQDPAMTPTEEFAEALKALGCIVTGKHPIMDGNQHRIAVEGNKTGEAAGFYVGHLDGHPAGYIKNHRTGIDMTWKSKGYALDSIKKAQLHADAAIKLAERAAEQASRQEAAAQRVAHQMKNLLPITERPPYLQTKGIQPSIGIFTDQDNHNIYIPAFDSAGKLWTLQTIQENGTKRFAKDSRKEGCFHPVGGMDALKTAPVLVIAEGYATAASLLEALDQATVAAFDAGNLLHVTQALHEKFPDKPILIAGDDDRHVEATQGINPGRVKAEAAAKAVGGMAVFPIFTPRELASNPKAFTDFNDLASKSKWGKAGVKRQIGTAISQLLTIERGRREKSQKLDPN
jgi:antirestriction protein ArdC/phage/plasmid primase-like uncharacterized protein